MIRVTTRQSSKATMRNWMIPPPYVMNPELKRRGIERPLFVGWPGPVMESGRLSVDEEVLLFKQFHYCGYRLSKIYQAANRMVTRSLRADYNLWVQRYHQVRTRLIEGNLGLVYQLIGRSRFNTIEREEMVSEGMMALLRAVDTFDPWRGFRFSTYACNAILRAFSRAAMLDTRRRVRVAGPYDPEFEEGDLPEIKRDDQRDLYTERLRRILHQDEADLTKVEKLVLARRFPFREGRKRETLEEIGRRMQVSKERVRQIQISAIGKLRKAIAEDTILN